MPAKTQRVSLNLIFDYPVYWSKYKVLRDLIQNFYDSVPRDEWVDRFHHAVCDSQLTLRATDVGFSYDWLIPIGASTKRESAGHYAGYFGEGFKIAALCAQRDFGWQIQVRSRDWELLVVTDMLEVDGRQLPSLGYDIKKLDTPVSDTSLIITPFDDARLLDVVLMSFFYPQNPLLGEPIWCDDSVSVYFRSKLKKPYGLPQTASAHGEGVIFASFQVLGSIKHPLVFCQHDFRTSDRERNTFYLIDVMDVLQTIAQRLPAPAAARVLVALKRHWYEYKSRRDDYESWYPIIRSLVSRVAECPETSAQWKSEFPHLLVAEPVRRGNIPRYNRRRQALDWWRSRGRPGRLVQEGFLAMGYRTLEDACAKADGFTVTRTPSAQEQQKIDILTAAAERIVPDLVAEIGTPPCWIIKNNRAVWQGMTSCMPGPLAAVRWRGLRVRYRLPYVAVHEALLRDSTFGDALGTYLHELAHVFGGDSSASFSDALTEMMAAVCGQAKVLEQLQQRWVN